MFFLRPDVVGLNVLKYTLLFRGHVETSKGRLQHRRCNSLYKFTGYFPKNLEGIKYKKIIKWFSNSNSLLKILNKITPGLYSAAYINYQLSRRKFLLSIWRPRYLTSAMGSDDTLLLWRFFHFGNDKSVYTPHVRSLENSHEKLIMRYGSILSAIIVIGKSTHSESVAILAGEAGGGGLLGYTVNYVAV